ncbi:MAG: D-aminoacyl-tRNA deacylase [Dehalococcoidia bacterium]|nr:D-aminoacyl-tRNA deacylase [Dehalococcoidia bacterium]MDZ4246670.1 D-aminoacyl-tRNA deacylase [Dehalococcoidia bacterium]
MKALIQRVKEASVTVEGEIVGNISCGLVVFVGVAANDGNKDASILVDKIVNMRIFPDGEGKFNLSALETRAELLLVSQFTLLADTRKGRRPSFTDAAPQIMAEQLFSFFVTQSQATGLKVATGRFQQHMLVNIQNDGPVTLLLDSRTWTGK